MANKVNPWIGLESYKEGEILYGRDEDIRSLLECILNDRETLLYGRSGIGKSSILNAGILPVVRNQGFLPVVIRLSHKGKPDYLQQIKEAIANAMLPPELDESGFPVELSEDEQARRNEALSRLMPEVVPCKDPEKESFYEFFHRHTFHSDDGKRIKLLIIFDQFEELFSLQEKDSNKKEFFADLADLLNDIMPEYLQHGVLSEHETVPSSAVSGEMNIDDLLADFKIDLAEDRVQYVNDNQVHVVFTIREDYLSEFEFYSALIPSLKRNRFALRPINEEQAAQIIMSPIPGLVSKDVAKLIIKKVTNDKVDFNLDGVPEIEVDSAVLSLYLSRLFDSMKGDAITAELVEQKGGEIISEFYIDALEGISEHTIDYLEYMLLNGKGKRDNITVDDAKEDGKVSDEELNLLCNKRKVLRLFNHAGALRIEFIHDILCDVVKKHKEDREHQRLQEEELKQLLQEEERKRLEFEQKAEEEMARLEAEAVRIKMRNRKRLTWIAGILGATVACLIVWWFLWQRPYSEYYGNFTTKNGWPIGVGDQLKLADNDLKKKLIVHYRLTRRGYLEKKLTKTGHLRVNPFTTVEVLSHDGKRTENLFYEIPMVSLLDAELDDEKARDFALLQKQVAYWEYVASDDSYLTASKCTAFSDSGEELFSIQFVRDDTYDSNDERKYVQWAMIADKEGKQLMVAENGIDRMRQTINDGLVTGCLFFNYLGVPQTNSSNVYGYQYVLNDTTHLVQKRYAVDRFGSRIKESEVIFQEYECGRVKRSSDFIVVSPEIGVLLFVHDSFTDTLSFNKNGRLKYGSMHVDAEDISRVVYEYGSDGKLLMRQKFSGDDLKESAKYQYERHSARLLACIHYNNGETYTEKYHYPDVDTEIHSFWRGNAKMMKTRSVSEWKSSISYHQCIKKTKRDTSYITDVVEFRDTLGNLIEGERGLAMYTISYELLTGNPKLKYHYDASEAIRKSEWNDYDEYGNKVARAVAGIDGTPVRSSEWDWDGLCYYKMAVLRDINDIAYVGIEGKNEFDEKSFVTDDGKEYVLYELPFMRMHIINEKEFTYQYGICLAQERINEVSNASKAPYIHVYDRNGSVGDAICLSVNANDRVNKQHRILDGDIICEVGEWNLFESSDMFDAQWQKLQFKGGKLKVLRVEGDGYVDLEFMVRPGNLCARCYMMPLTEAELIRIKRYL